MTTVLTLEPLSGNWAIINGPGGTMKRNFGGAGLPWLAWEGPTTREWLGLPVGTRVRRVKYPASLAPRSINDGVRALRDAIANTPGPLLVFGHSQGAQVASRLLCEGGQGEPDRVEYLLIGNPLRKYGGYGVGQPEVDGRTGLPTPTDTPFRVHDVKLRFDGWADWPTDPTNVWARANANQDRVGINGPKAIHCYGYRTAQLDDPGRKIYREGLTEFVLLPHDPLLRIDVAAIEAGYRRPER